MKNSFRPDDFIRRRIQSAPAGPGLPVKRSLLPATGFHLPVERLLLPFAGRLLPIDLLPRAVDI
jgi:hypothetical protein